MTGKTWNEKISANLGVCKPSKDHMHRHSIWTFFRKLEEYYFLNSLLDGCSASFSRVQNMGVVRIVPHGLPLRNRCTGAT